MNANHSVTAFIFSIVSIVAGCSNAGDAGDAQTGDDANMTEGPKATATYERSCTVTKLVDDSVLEESLSVEEYPDVSVQRTKAGVITVSFGASDFSSKGDKEVQNILLTTKGTSDSTTYITTTSGESYVLKIAGKEGEILYARGRELPRTLANLACKTTP